MGLILNTAVHTKQGFEVATGSYLNISEYYINKNTKEVQIAVNIWKDKASREENKHPFSIDEIPSPLKLSLTTTELASDDVFTVVYTKLKTVINDAFGATNIAVDDI